MEIANEADLGALAETRRGAARGLQNIIFIQGEVGVGGGLFVDGHAMAGAAGYGGEVGHMPVNPKGVPCHCGSVGCWETEIGEDALLTRAGHPRGGGRDEVEAVLREATAGELPALEAMDYVGRWLGLGIAGLVNLLNPERVVLGGRFGRLFPFVAETVARQLDNFALAAPRRLVTVVPAQLGEDASLLGAAELAFEPFLSDPAAWHRPRSRTISALASANRENRSRNDHPSPLHQFHCHRPRRRGPSGTSQSSEWIVTGSGPACGRNGGELTEEGLRNRFTGINEEELSE